MVFNSVPRNAIIDALVHIRDLHRRIKPSNEREIRAYERREAATRDLLSNLPRTNEHPTLKTLLEIAEICSLTLEGAHRLFGYDLEAIRDFDLRLNGGRTHIEGSHECLRAGEIHRSLRMSDASAGKREEGWSHLADGTHQLRSESKLSPSLSQRENRTSGVDRRKKSASAEHRHLHRLVSVGYAVMIGRLLNCRPICLIDRVIARIDHPPVDMSAPIPAKRVESAHPSLWRKEACEGQRWYSSILS